MLVHRIAPQCCLILFYVLASYGTAARPAAGTSSHQVHGTSVTHAVLTPSQQSGAILPQVHPSPVAYRRAFKINLPLKPKLLKHIQFLHKKKNQSTKRDTKYNHFYQQRHVPFIKSITMLFDSILNQRKNHSNYQRPEISNIFRKNKINTKYYATRGEEASNNSFAVERQFKENQAAIISAQNSSTEAGSDPKNSNTETTVSRSIPSEVSSPDISLDISSTAIPVLPPADTLGSRRNHERHSNGSSSRNNTDDKGFFTRNSGNATDISEIRTPRIISEGTPKHTNDAPRNSTNSSITNETRGNERRVASIGHSTGSPILPQQNFLNKTEERTREIGAGYEPLENKNKIESRRNKSKGSRKGLGSRLRGHLARIEEDVNEESVQSDINITNGVNCDTQDDSSNQSKLIRNSTVAGRDKITTSGEQVGILFGTSLANITENRQLYTKPIEIISGYSNYTVVNSETKQ